MALAQVLEQKVSALEKVRCATRIMSSTDYPALSCEQHCPQP